MKMHNELGIFYKIQLTQLKINRRDSIIDYNFFISVYWFYNLLSILEFKRDQWYNIQI